MGVEVLQIKYKNKGLEKVCTNFGTAKKKHGKNMAEIIHQRIDQMTAAESVEFMIKFRIGNCHSLKGKRQGQYAVDLVQPNRLVFSKVENEVRIVCIEEIVDYH